MVAKSAEHVKNSQCRSNFSPMAAKSADHVMSVQQWNTNWDSNSNSKLVQCIDT